MHTRTKSFRSFSAALATVALLVVATASAGAGEASARPAPPVVSVAPVASGPPLVGHALTAASGSWTGTAPIAFSYQWQRCDSAGASCVAIAGASAQTYLLGSSDIGQTIRVLVGASNAAGGASALSGPTEPIAANPPPAAVLLPNGAVSIPAASVLLPDRLRIAQVRLLPPRPVPGRPLVVRVQVGDTAGYLVRGALVSAQALPSGLYSSPPETTSASDGRASVTLRPTRVLTLEPGLAPALLVRVRKPGEPPAGGSSTSFLGPLPLAVSAGSNPYAGLSRGYDLSYPDCARARPTPSPFAILGVNGGRPFTFNPCLTTEYGWYAATGPGALYLNTGYEPRFAGRIAAACALAGSGSGGRVAQAYAVGCSEAASSLERVVLLGLPLPSLWWLDVETSNRWSRDRQLNTEVLRGMIDFLDKLRPQPVVGIYSRPSWWREITGGWQAAVPEWVPGGSCQGAFSTGPVWLMQGGTSSLDVDQPC